MAAPSSSLQENKWLEVYIDALADRGGSRLGPEETALVRKGEALAVPLGMHFFATQASQAPPEALARAWRRASAGGPHSERESRVTNTSWRLWHMAMRRENARLEELAAARQRPSYGADIPEEDSDVEDEADQDNDDKAKEMEPSSPSARENPLVHFAPDESLPRPPPLPPRSLYVVMISLHGLVRGHEMELGKDADTGGQVKYVVDMARELGKHPLVARVDLLTRLIEDPAVDPSYANPLEPLDESGRSFIVRIPCGDPAVYLPKEQLWPHVREFSDRAVPTIGATLESLNKDDADGESHTHVRLACVHGHYADAGEVASNIACTLGVPMVLTGHSLGRNKREHLLRAGRLTPAEIERKYNISRRIEGEERALNVADMVVTSTAQEIAEQWALYDGYAPRLASVLRKTAARTGYGRSMALMKIIPPGVGGLEAVAEDASPNANNARDQAEGAGDDASSSPTERSMPLRKDASHASSIADLASMDEAGAPTPAFWEAANRFLRQPGKPVILAMCRPDAKKNVTSLVKAFGSTPGLKDIANLVLVLGTRDNVEELSVGAQAVVNDVLHLIDRYDVYGSVAMPKHHTQADVPDIYKLAFSTGFAAGTEEALMYFQACNGLADTGVVDEATWDALIAKSGFQARLDEAPAAAAPPPPPPPPAPAPAPPPPPASSEFQRRHDIGSPAPEADAPTKYRFTKHYASETVFRPIVRLEEGGADVREMQAAMSRAGFDCGDDDMEYWYFGYQTEEALKTFQSANGLPESGVCCAMTWVALLGEEAVATPRVDDPDTDPGNLDDGFGSDSCRLNADLDCNSLDDKGGVYLLGEQRWERRA